MIRVLSRLVQHKDPGGVPHQELEGVAGRRAETGKYTLPEFSTQNVKLLITKPISLNLRGFLKER